LLDKIDREQEEAKKKPEAGEDAAKGKGK